MYENITITISKSMISESIQGMIVKDVNTDVCGVLNTV